MSAPLPIRLRSLLERWMSERKYGAITIHFKGGGVPQVQVNETVRLEDLPLPPLNEPERETGS